MNQLMRISLKHSLFNHPVDYLVVLGDCNSFDDWVDLFVVVFKQNVGRQILKELRENQRAILL